jgi:hypothetical protein
MAAPKPAAEVKPAAKKPDPERDEFMVVALADDLRVGSSIRIIGVSETEADAKKLLEGLGDASTGRVAILEKKAVFSRRPAVVVTLSSENIVAKE